MVLLSLFISIADSSLLTALVVAVSVLVDVIMFLVKIPAVETYVDKTTLPAIAFGAVPDLFFGYSSPDSLATYFDRLGDDGRVAYKALSRWDYFPYMECYVLLLGSLLIRASRKTNINESVALVAPLIMFFDVIENTVLGNACDAAPYNVSETSVFIASTANKIKWILFVISLLFSVTTLAVSAVSGKSQSDKKSS